MRAPTIRAKDFHPMRGHVEDGAKVVFSDGCTLTISGVMGGWALVDEHGKQIGATAAGAFDLLLEIVRRES